MARVSKLKKQLTYGVTATVSISLVLLGALILPSSIFNPAFDNYIVVALIILFIPIIIINRLEKHWIRKIENSLPSFLDDLASSQRTGMPFAKALETLADRQYGPLTKELKSVVAKMSMGMTYLQALDMFGKRVSTPLVNQAVLLLQQVARAGGNVQDALDMIATHIREVQNLEKERRATLRPYIFIIYISFAVFLSTIAILYVYFFLPISSFSSKVPFLPAGFPIQDVKRSLYHMSIIEAVGGGLVGGKMTGGSATEGLKHSLLLLIAALITFTVIA